ncbi:DUF185-domain-containing protein [Polychaeton citri CBS 116435]|uniref:Protein arginine methyltransferase NDUFAF7 n=1 Tax=Polychaeton citri CBS 116435 TaxID=1314669 RepID=A0A9P4QF42_9PEZI|nr:DUF185-domain-containing protein [Polychaeton citri CBS 116435]
MRSCLFRAARQIPRNVYPVDFRPRWTPSIRWSSTDDGHKWSTSLAKTLAEAITTTGPIPVASFMRQCLTSDLGGYYSSTLTSETPIDDQFGTKGDFITSPEISQVFGELVGIWFVAEWISQGRKSNNVYLMEVGPGRGTLMDDILRTIRNFRPMLDSLEAVYLVESDSKLRAKQCELLCGQGIEPVKNELGWEGKCKHAGNLKIVWVEDVRLIPRDGSKMPFIVAHEFFDALPIHVFQSVPPAPTQQLESGDKVIQTPTGPIPVPERQRQSAREHQWRELVVSPRPPHRLEESDCEFELTMSRGATPHSMYLPELSPRYRALKSTTDATIEISPESHAYAADFAVRVGGSNLPKDAELSTSPDQIREQQLVSQINSQQEDYIRKSDPSGAALIVDYGPAGAIPANSLRGIRHHTLVSPFHTPGLTDLSADVDFLALAEAAINASPGVEVHGPVDQGRFLTAMGIEERAAQLVKRAFDKERGGSTGRDKKELTEVVKRVDSGWKRLVDRGPQGMGRLYQVMAIVPYKPVKQGEAKSRPVGFGGDLRT